MLIFFRDINKRKLLIHNIGFKCKNLTKAWEFTVLRCFNFDLNITFRTLLIEQIKLGKRDFWNEVLRTVKTFINTIFDDKLNKNS